VFTHSKIGPSSSEQKGGPEAALLPAPLSVAPLGGGLPDRFRPGVPLALPAPETVLSALIIPVSWSTAVCGSNEVDPAQGRAKIRRRGRRRGEAHEVHGVRLA
jgi:hypothetical protein